ncbi:11814_t:CDS:2 [Funneliformis geosporum]|uniref:11814_t:CDS:1 n=1 Tax=Funneliformis geosporum TaxID=1117311 RepID=A0A9W4STY2_9GLOM|nr:11814_t:CDS:2 [Funneliformis geosporum]
MIKYIRQRCLNYQSNQSLVIDSALDQISSIAYIDDTTLISNSQDNLNSLLKITDSFNNLNNILLNDDKGILIITANPSCIQYSTSSDPDSPTSQNILLQYNNKNILILLTPESESIRFLGV